MSTIHEAVVKALAELQNPVKDAKADTGRFAYSYATLPTILDLVRPVLAKHGLAVMQDVTMGEGGLQVYTTIRHTTGEGITFGPIVGRAGGGDWQALGSAITYARRYALTAALGIAADDDDDAQATKRPERSSSPAEEDPWQTPPPLPPSQGVPERKGSARVEQARQEMGSYPSPSGRRHPRGDEPATDKQKDTLDKWVQPIGYEGLAQFLAAEAPLLLGGEVTAEQLTKAHAEVIFDALKRYKAEEGRR